LKLNAARLSPVASRKAQTWNRLKSWLKKDMGEKEEERERSRILSEQLNDYREICWRSDAISKDGCMSTPSCELFNSSKTKFVSPLFTPLLLSTLYNFVLFTNDGTLFLFILVR